MYAVLTVKQTMNTFNVKPLCKLKLFCWWNCMSTIIRKHCQHSVI